MCNHCSHVGLCPHPHRGPHDISSAGPWSCQVPTPPASRCAVPALTPFGDNTAHVLYQARLLQLALKKVSAMGPTHLRPWRSQDPLVTLPCPPPGPLPPKAEIQGPHKQLLLCALLHEAFTDCPVLMMRPGKAIGALSVQQVCQKAGMKMTRFG